MELKKQNDLFLKTVFSMIIPIAMQHLMAALVSMTDAVMLGFLSQNALSSVSLAAEVQFVFSMFACGISAGLGMMLAQYWGKHDIAGVSKVIPIALRPNIIFGLVFTGLAFFIPERLMSILTDVPELIVSGGVYLKAVALSYILFSVSQIYLMILKNTGRTKLSSYISSTAMILNIAGNAVLIFGLLGFPAMGIKGAAAATVISRAIELIWSFTAVQSGKYKFRFGLLDNDIQLRKDFIKYTLPILGASLVWGIAFSLHSVVLGHMGADAVAANSIALIVKDVLSCFIRGLGGATSITIGNILGTGDFEKAKDYGRRLALMSLIFGVITGLVIMLLSPVISGFASITDTAKHYLQLMLIYLGFNIMAQSMNHIIIDGILVAGGDAKFDMYGNIVTMWCVCLPAGFIAAFVLNVSAPTVFLILNLDEIVKLAAVIARYRQYKWLRNITR